MSMPKPDPQQSAVPNLVNIEAVRKHSELFRAECKRMILETDKKCKHMRDEDNKRLDQHVREIQFLKKELELKLEEIIMEINPLVTLKSRVMKARDACKEPLRVNDLCLEERMKRFPSERLHDEVDRELLKEKKIIEAAASLLQRAVDQITEQIRLNRSAEYQLEQVLKEKSEAQRIETSCALMTTHSLNNMQSSTNTKTLVPNLPVTPKHLAKISDISLANAEQQRSNSLSLRALVESMLEQTAADMQKQVHVTTAAFQLNVQEIKNAKIQMEDQLAKILSEFGSQKNIKDDLKVAITETELFRSLAQARLDQSQLLAEVQQLTTQINKLHEAVAQAEEEQRALVRCQLGLQENIEIKANSLYIDEVVCAQHREPIVIHHF